jgi:hypothetical protein
MPSYVGHGQSTWLVDCDVCQVDRVQRWGDLMRASASEGFDPRRELFPIGEKRGSATVLRDAGLVTYNAADRAWELTMAGSELLVRQDRVARGRRKGRMSQCEQLSLMDARAERAALLRQVAKRFARRQRVALSEHEEWRPAKGYPDYEVSSLGRVVSYRQSRVRILVPGTHSAQTIVVLTRAGKRTRFVSLGGLVLDSFEVPRPAGRVACKHRDSDRTNFALSNLYWGPTEAPRFLSPADRAARNAAILESLRAGMSVHTVAREQGTHRVIVQRLARVLRAESADEKAVANG